ncbi:MAG: glycosyltransferase family 2 protein [Geminocystis sp.]|nr:glycosyltransferase family 2 protein [Geminocystis sp.]
MAKGCLISIITPTYNHEDFIEDCIESVLLQTYDNWEMIIVDDASTDRTPEIVSEYAQKDKRIKFIRHKENYGPFNLDRTYNEALELAKGEWIAILEGDDVWLPYKLERQVQVIRELPEDVVVLGGVGGYILQREKLILIPKRLSTRYSIKFLEPFDPIPTMLNGMMPTDIALTLMLKRSALLKIGGFIQKPKNIVAVDFPTLLRLGKVGRFYNDNYIVGFWRRYSASVSTSYEEMQSKATREAIEDFLKEQGIPHELDECSSYMQNFRMTIRKIIDGNYAEAEEYLKNFLRCMEQKPIQDSLMKIRIAILKLAISLRARHILKLAYDIKYRLQYETLGKYEKKFIRNPIYSKVYKLET